MLSEDTSRVILPVDEQRVRELIAEQLAKMPSSRGCVCPVGAEALCRGLMCPRKPVRLT